MENESVRICTKCITEKLITQFKQCFKSTRRRRICKSCNTKAWECSEKAKAGHKRYYDKYCRTAVASSHITRRYGITEEQYKRLLEIQNNACAICQKTSKRRFCVDHCHKTNRVRGLLCYLCNIMLGRLDDNPRVFEKVIRYLEDTTDLRNI